PPRHAPTRPLSLHSPSSGPPLRTRPSPPPSRVPPYAALHSQSNFRFLAGGSHPYELAARAAELEMPALAITDHGGVYGAVRHLQACRKLGVRPLIGATLEVDKSELVLIARNLAGYSRLCRLLTVAHQDEPKGE